MEHIQREIEDERRSGLMYIAHTGVGSLGSWGVPPGLTSSGHNWFPVAGANMSPPRLLHVNFDELLQGLTEKAVASSQSAAAPARAVERVNVRTLREREVEWRRTHPEILKQFENEWVALEGEKIIAHGPDAADVIKAARAEGIRKPYVFFVEPKDENVIMYGL